MAKIAQELPKCQKTVDRANWWIVLTGRKHKDDVKLICFAVWREALSFDKIEEEFKVKRKLQSTKRMENVHVIWTRLVQTNARMMWQLARIMGGRHVGYRKSKFRQARMDDPELDEWLIAMGKSGEEGGCKAVEVQRGENDKYYVSGCETAQLDNTHARIDDIFDVDGLLGIFKSC